VASAIYEYLADGVNAVGPTPAQCWRDYCDQWHAAQFPLRRSRRSVIYTKAWNVFAGAQKGDLPTTYASISVAERGSMAAEMAVMSRTAAFRRLLGSDVERG
jgi:hypothetical protein